MKRGLTVTEKPCRKIDIGVDENNMSVSAWVRRYSSSQGGRGTREGGGGQVGRHDALPSQPPATADTPSNCTSV